MNGTTCTQINLTNCYSSGIPQSCTTSEEAEDLQSLLNMLSVNGTIYTSPVFSTTAPYNGLFNTLLASYLPAASNWTWQSYGGNEFRIISAIREFISGLN